MLEAEHAARLARQTGNEDLAHIFDIAYQEAERQRVLSLAVEGIRREVCDASEVNPGTDLAGKALGLRAFDFARNLTREQVITLEDAHGAVVRINNAYLRNGDDHPEIPTHFVVTVQDPGENVDLLRQVKPGLLKKEDHYQSAEIWRSAVDENFTRYMLDARPGFYIGIDPLNLELFGRISIPSFIRSSDFKIEKDGRRIVRGTELAEPSQASFAPISDLESQQFATALLDFAEI